MHLDWYLTMNSDDNKYRIAYQWTNMIMKKFYYFINKQIKECIFINFGLI